MTMGRKGIYSGSETYPIAKNSNIVYTDVHLHLTLDIHFCCKVTYQGEWLYEMIKIARYLILIMTTSYTQIQNIKTESWEMQV